MKDLLKLEFDAQRYLEAPQTVIQDVIQMNPSLKHIDVKAYLDGRLRKVFEEAIQWGEPLLIQDIIHLNIAYKGERYRIYMDLTHRELVVSMIVDGKPLNSKSALYVESSNSFVKETLDGVVISEYGLQVVKGMVTELLIRNYRNLA